MFVETSFVRSNEPAGPEGPADQPGIRRRGAAPRSLISARFGRVSPEGREGCTRGDSPRSGIATGALSPSWSCDQSVGSGRGCSGSRVAVGPATAPGESARIQPRSGTDRGDDGIDRAKRCGPRGLGWPIGAAPGRLHSGPANWPLAEWNTLQMLEELDGWVSCRAP